MGRPTAEKSATRAPQATEVRLEMVHHGVTAAHAEEEEEEEEEEDPIVITVSSNQVRPLIASEQWPERMTTHANNAATSYQIANLNADINNNNNNNNNEYKDEYDHGNHHEDDSIDDTDFDCILCGETRIRQIGAGSSCFCSLFADNVIDLRGKRLPSRASLFVTKLCGDTRVYVPRGTHVSVKRLLLCGSKDVELEPPLPGINQDETPCITLYVLMLCGSITVRSEGLMRPIDNR